ncbi:MAG: TPM domain-containing protein, partial [Candidatus Binatia bacterium]
DDRGLLLLLAVEQRRVRFFSGYGLEGLLPDGKLGAILDTYATPALRGGDISAGLYNAALAAAQVIAADAGVTLSGQPSQRPRSGRRVNPLGLIWLLFAFPGMLLRGRRRRGLMYMPMFFGGTLGGGGFGGGLGGGFGGLGGGFGGGGAGRGW